MYRNKSLINIVCLVLFIFSLIPQIQSKAQTYVYGDFEYVYSNTEDYIELTKYNGSDSSPVIPSSINGIDVRNLSRNNFPSTFENNKSITSIIIPEGIINMGDNTFNGCSNLKSIKVPSTMIHIFGSNTPFSGCDSLESIEVHPDNKDYTSVDGIVFNKDKTRLRVYPPDKAGDEYSVPDGVKSLGYQSFWGNNNIKKIILSKSVTSIDDEAWLKSNFKEVVVPDNVIKIHTAFGIVPYDFTVYGYKYSLAIKKAKEAHLKYKYINVNAPRNLKVIKNKRLVNLGWKSSDNASGYEIWRADPNSKYKKISTIRSKSTNTFSDNKVKRNISYKYCIKSYRMVQQGTTYSKAGKVSYPVKKLMSDKNAYISVKVK